jgi:hypothetical protein
VTSDAQQSRVDTLVRLVGIITLGFGLALVYMTYINVGATGMAPEIITVNMSLGILLTIVGLLAFLAKFK